MQESLEHFLLLVWLCTGTVPSHGFHWLAPQTGKVAAGAGGGWSVGGRQSAELAGPKALLAAASLHHRGRLHPFRCTPVPGFEQLITEIKELQWVRSPSQNCSGFSLQVRTAMGSVSMSELQHRVQSPSQNCSGFSLQVRTAAPGSVSKSELQWVRSPSQNCNGFSLQVRTAVGSVSKSELQWVQSPSQSGNLRSSVSLTTVAMKSACGNEALRCTWYQCH